ncbi:MAG: hypothetical protein CVU48_04060 [Candidatus Cloacimonetes bacterium HGW-Cloacimonetes-1]|jgi:glutamyl-tRNA reductase|nr:MAG: hypothetical protein CVU48_04060 [Candidatus Cloacimonetes bacterium HGW-Cloacimonetes-1]
MMSEESTQERLNQINGIVSAHIERLKTKWRDRKAESFFFNFHELSAGYSKKLTNSIKDYSEAKRSVNSIVNYYYKEFEQ